MCLLLDGMTMLCDYRKLLEEERSERSMLKDIVREHTSTIEELQTRLSQAEKKLSVCNEEFDNQVFRLYLFPVRTYSNDCFFCSCLLLLSRTNGWSEKSLFCKIDSKAWRAQPIE